MKKFLTKFLVIGIALLAVWCKNNYKSTKESIVKLGNTGISIKLPNKYEFEETTSEKNDYFGQSIIGEWAIFVNHEEKDDFPGLEVYALSSAIANKAGEPKTASDGNYYYEYKNGEYHLYTAIRQNDKYYYTITFYCYEKDWSNYEDDFAEWATTIKLEQK